MFKRSSVTHSRNHIWAFCTDMHTVYNQTATKTDKASMFPIGAIPLYQRTAGDPLTPGTGQIWLDNVNCNLTANRLIDCSRSNAIGVHNCNHGEDAGVRCEPIGFRGMICIAGQGAKQITLLFVSKHFMTLNL